MKHVFIVCALVASFACVAQAQTLVSTDPYHRIVVLEEFTGIHCGYCPDGHRIANALRDKYNNEPVLINIHSGGYAVPSTGEPDFRTQFGDSLDRQSQLTGYPAGTVNRHIYPELIGTTALSRGQWDAAAVDLMAIPSPVNVGLKSKFDPTSRLLTVDVELYYTSDAPAKDNNLNVVLLENDVISVQSDYTNGTQQNYHHKHMLRWMLSGQWGDAVTTTTKGSLVTRTYTYTVPSNFKIENCDVAAYVAEGHQEIYSGAQVVADGGTTQIVSSVGISGAIAVTTPTAENRIYPSTILNKVGVDEIFSFEIVPTMPADWTAVLKIDGAVYTGSDVLIAKDAAKALNVEIMPGATSGVAKVDLIVHSKNYPKSPQVKRTFYLMSGVQNLLMSHPDGVKYDSVYTRSMSTAGLTATGTMDRNVFEIFSDAAALNGLKNLYYNVSWAFPGITVKSMGALKTLMDNGTNLFVAGQDFGWDLASPDTNAHGNDDTKLFYNNYIMADFIADGGTANTRLTPIATEPIFKSVPASTITAPYGSTYLYPDEFKPRSGAFALFNYNSLPSKIAGLRAEKNYKLVYLGVGLEQLTPATGNQIITQVKRWFNNEISSVEFDDLIATGSTVFPNPATDKLEILLSQTIAEGNVQLFDATGRVVLNQRISNSPTTLGLSLESLSSGSYRLCISDDRTGTTHSTIVNVIR